MADRSVSVALRMQVRDYIAGAGQAIAANKALAASQRDMGREANKTGAQVSGLGAEIEKTGATAEREGRRMGRGLLYSAIGVAALGASGGALKALPPLLAAAGAGAAVLPQALLGTAAAGGVLKASLSGVGKELQAVIKGQDQFGRTLAPNAKLFVSQYAAMRPALQGIQQGLQQRVFAGTAQDLQLLTTHTLPQLSGGLNKIADDWSALFAEIALNANSPEAVGAFNTITASADRFFDDINARVRPLGKSISTLIVSADPVARAFGDELVGWIDRFNTAVERARKSGSLGDLFKGATQAAHELMSISGDILRITGMVIREASASNSATVDASASLRAYVASGRAAGDVAGIVHTLTVAWEGLRDVLGPIGALLRDALADPGTAASVAQFFQFLAAGSQVLSTILRLFLDLNNVTGGVLLALVGLALGAAKVTQAINLATVAATKGAASLTRYGVAGASAGKALGSVAAGAGKLVGALFLLQAVHEIFQAFAGDAVNVEALDTSVRKMAEGAAASGEMTRLFGANLEDLGTQAHFLDDNPFANFLRGAEKAVPLAGDLASALGSDTFTGSAENFAALDAAIAKYGNTTKDVEGTSRLWNQVLEKSGLDTTELAKRLPGAWAELQRLQAESHAAGSGMQGLAERTALLNAPLNEAVTLGRSLLDVFTELNGGAIGFAKAQSAAEEAVDQLTAGLDKNGLALNKQKDGFNLNNEKGRANLALTLSLSEAGAKAAQARLDEGGTIEQAAGVYDQYIGRLRAALAVQGATPAQIDAIIGGYTKMPAALEAAGAAANELNTKLAGIPKGTKFTFNGETMVDGNGKALELSGSLKGIPPGKTFTWNGKSLVDGKGKAIDLAQAVQDIPPTKSTKVTVPGIDPLTGKVEGLAEELQGMPDGNAAIHVDAGGAYATIRQVRQSLANLGGAIAAVPRQRGGVTLRAAAEGLLQPMIAPPGTRYQWAEPQTGGELFLPRRGINTSRGRQLLGVAAQWYGGEFVPTKAMARGGYTAAASGLVNVAPADTSSTPVRATRLDYAETYLRARDAVKAMSTSLKENGRAFGNATVKGRENRQALFSVIRAAQDAAKTKYEETGSVKAANLAYAEHIRRLRATLAQQGVNARTIRQLLSVAAPPRYEQAKPKAPGNSLANVAFARAAIAVGDGSTDLADKLSLNRAGVGLGTDFGRENLGSILDFLELAERAAQERYDQTKNAKLATTLYNGQIAELRRILRQAGYPAATIASLISRYGRITLTPNERGGVYMAAGGLASLGQPQMFAGGGATMYGFAEPGTGGELFVPRHGDRQRGRDLLSIGAGWYGGRFVAGSDKATAAAYDYSTHMTVHALTYNPSTAELLTHQRTVDAQARVGRRY